MSDASSPRAPLEVIDPNWYGTHGPPHEAWTRLRRDAPVAYCEPPGMLSFWSIVKYDDIVRISRDPEHFRNAPRIAVFPEEQFATDNFPVRHLLNMDPPEHRDYRRLLSGHFTPRAVETKRAAVERLVDDLLDGLGERTEIDFVTDVAAVLPLEAIAEMLGLPVEDRPLFFRWTNETLGATDPEYQEGATVHETTARAVQAQKDYFHAHGRAQTASAYRRFHWHPRQREARRSLDSGFRAAVVFDPARSGGQRDDAQRRQCGLLALIQNPAEFAKLKRSPELVRSATEESVRWVTAGQSVLPYTRRGRGAARTAHPAGEHLCLFYGSANRDEAVFDEPFAFRIERNPNPHIAFGIGEHVCLGAHLARLELQALFRKLFERVDRIELAGPVERLQSSFISGIKHLRYA
jgi:cytochrome P450